MEQMSELAKRIWRLEAREDIRALAARYCTVIDDRDVEGIYELFTQDCSFRSKDGVMAAHGVEAVVAQFKGRFAALGVTNHFIHEHVIRFDPDDDNRAFGYLTSHVEVWRNGQAMIAAIRYADIYRLDRGSWRFADRELSFLYYLPVKDYAEALGGQLRQRAYGDLRNADYPESLPTWRRYHGS